MCIFLQNTMQILTYSIEALFHRFIDVVEMNQFFLYGNIRNGKFEVDQNLGAVTMSLLARHFMKEPSLRKFDAIMFPIECNFTKTRNQYINKLTSRGLCGSRLLKFN